MFTRRWTWILLASIMGCADNPGAPEPPSPEPLPDPSPVALLRTISTLFNDTGLPAIEKNRIYDSLFSPDAVFICPDSMPVPPSMDCAYPFRPKQAHAIFDDTENGTLYAVNVRITYGPPIPLDPPEPGREGWQEVMITNIYMRLMFNLEDGLETHGAMARVRFAPRANDQWVIAEWVVLARPLVTRSIGSGW